VRRTNGKGRSSLESIESRPLVSYVAVKPDKMRRVTLSGIVTALTAIGPFSPVAAEPHLAQDRHAQHVFGPPTRHSSSTSRPNIVFILTDDQDLHMNSLDYVPLIKKHLIDQGTRYTKHFCTTAICCPARVSILTGKLAHNTNVTDIAPPYGRLPPPGCLRGCSAA